MSRKNRAIKYVLCRDSKQNTCLKVNEKRGVITFIPLEVTGLVVHHTATKSFWARYRHLNNFPVERACQLYLNYCRNLNVEKEVLIYLSKVVKIPQELYSRINYCKSS
jgi:hypothetical protein